MALSITFAKPLQQLLLAKANLDLDRDEPAIIHALLAARQILDLCDISPLQWLKISTTLTDKAVPYDPALNPHLDTTPFPFRPITPSAPGLVSPSKEQTHAQSQGTSPQQTSHDRPPFETPPTVPEIETPERPGE